jgi:hypothetical protein
MELREIDLSAFQSENKPKHYELKQRRTQYDFTSTSNYQSYSALISYSVGIRGYK